MVWTEPALEDIDGLLLYYDDSNPRYGVKLCRGVMTAVEQLIDFPELGPATQIGDQEIPGLRRFLFQHLIVVYRVDRSSDRILLLRVWDGRRDPDRLEILAWE